MFHFFLVLESIVQLCNLSNICVCLQVWSTSAERNQIQIKWSTCIARVITVPCCHLFKVRRCSCVDSNPRNISGWWPYKIWSQFLRLQWVALKVQLQAFRNDDECCWWYWHTANRWVLLGIVTSKCWALLDALTSKCWALLDALTSKCWALLDALTSKCWALLDALTSKCWALLDELTSKCWALLDALTSKCWALTPN